MEVKVVVAKENPLLKRKEVTFIVEHGPAGKTPGRSEVRRALANELKVEEGVVFVQSYKTKTGTSTASGFANVYESVAQAELVEPAYIKKRAAPPEKAKEAEATA